MSESPTASDTVTPTALDHVLMVFGGCLYFLGFAGFGYWPLSFVALVPLLWTLERCRQASAWAHLRVGFVYGLVTMAGGYHWLVTMLEVFSGYGVAMSALFASIFFAYMGLHFSFFSLLYGALRRRGISVIVCTCVALSIGERFYPALFPSFLGNSLFEQTRLIQIADLGGPILVSLLVAAVNCAIFATLWSRKHAPVANVARLWFATAAAFALTLTYGSWRMNTMEARIDAAPKLNVGLVQVNMGIFEKHRDVEEGHRRHLEQTLQVEREHDIDLMIWPESAYLFRLKRELPMEAAKVRGDAKSPILFGGISIESRPERIHYFNTAFMLDADNQIRTTYDKTLLLAFGEYIPFGEMFPKLYELSPNSGRFTPGSHIEPLLFGPWRITTLICYEDVLPWFTRRAVTHANPHLLVNLTNDAWFADSQEPAIHLALAQFRAVEQRRFLIRSTNSGVSAFIDPLGRVIKKTGVLTRENLVAPVAMLDGRTPYDYLGDWPAWASLLFAVFVLVLRRTPSSR